MKSLNKISKRKNPYEGKKTIQYLDFDFFRQKKSISKQNGCNSLKLHATDLQLGSKFSSGRWPLIYICVLMIMSVVSYDRAVVFCLFVNAVGWCQSIHLLNPTVTVSYCCLLVLWAGFHQTGRLICLLEVR